MDNADRPPPESSNPSGTAAQKKDDSGATPEQQQLRRRRAQKQRQKEKKGDGASSFVPPPPAPPARQKKRHWGLIFSFLLFVVAPLAVTAWYLFERAADQYASTMGFTVRKEDGPSSSELVGGLIDFSDGTSSDTDILYEFIQSQGLVERVDAQLDLRKIYTRPENDPVFTTDPESPIEDLVSYWQRMVTIYYDGNSGLIETRVLAFDPKDAQAISQAIFDESSRMINELTTIARDDATRYARDELDLSLERLKKSRAALTEFRLRTQIVDPAADIQGQMGLLNTLQAQLAEALIDLDLLNENTRQGDARIRQAEQRISVIKARIADERKKIGLGADDENSDSYARLVGEYESLVVDREFAEKFYLSALANYDAALAEAQRQSRYLAPYVRPTIAESAEYPQRFIILGVIGLFLFLAWMIAALVYYSIKDRR